MTTDTEALARRAYHFAGGAVLDVRGFTGLFAEFAQLGVLPDVTSAVAACAPPR